MNLEEKIAVARDFMTREVFPLEHAFLNGHAPDLSAVRAKVKALGLLAPHMPTEIGGGGFHFLQFARLAEELGKSPLGMLAFNCAAPDAGNMELMAKHATPDQREKFLLPLVRGEVRSCFTMTEPGNPGSNPTMLSTTAVSDGDHYVINGRKWFSSAADGAAFAIAMVVTNPNAPPHERASMIFVPTNTPGFRVVRNISVMGHEGQGYFTHCEVEYSNCRVPKTNLLGAEGKGFKLAQDRLGPGRIHHCMRWIGVSERALQLTIARARTRDLGKGMLGDMQTVQNWIAEGRAEVDAARLLVLNAAEKLDKGDARVEISCIKFFVPDVMMRVLGSCDSSARRPRHDGRYGARVVVPPRARIADL